MKKRMYKHLVSVAIFILVGTVCIPQTSKPIVKKSVFFGKSKPLSEMKIVLPGDHNQKMHTPENPFPFTEPTNNLKSYSIDKLKVQKEQGPIKGKGPILNFEGVHNVNNVFPGDPNGEIGLNHYIQTVNCSFAVWDKSGNLLYGPVDNASLWEAFPGPWSSNWFQDPVFKYDILADRWLVTAMVLDFNQELFFEMLAVSVSPDPLGEYYCYAFQFDNVNDYPKVSVWPDGYHVNYNMFTSDWDYLHSVVTVVDRVAMLAGQPEATMIQFQVPNPVNYILGLCPLSSDFRGNTLPDDSTNFVVLSKINFNTYEFTMDIYELNSDWTTPVNSTFELVTEFDFGTVPSFNWSSSAPQPGNYHNVETWIFRLMYPLTYRKFDNYEVMVTSHTMWDETVHYLKWYELRKEDADWYIYQTGNYAPDNDSRYMPSISINGKGDIAMGYTKSSLNLYPSIYITGRRKNDPLGEMSFQEIELFKGLNYVNNYWNGRNRWGDYTSMMVDPVDDSTFWYTSMYPINNTNQGNWSTRIVAFNLEEEILAPFAFAGEDTLICEDDYFFLTQGNAINYNSILWTGNGDGTFVVDNEVQAEYVRGDGDIENGQVMLTIHAYGYESGYEAVDSMILFINLNPLADAGTDDTIYFNESYTLQGVVEFSDEYEWTTSGDGTFNDPNLLDAIYTPGASDIASGEVELTLTALPLQACQDEEDDGMTLTIETTTGTDVVSEKFILKVSPNPVSGTVNVVGVLPESENVTMQMINANGEIMFTGKFRTEENRLSRQVDMSLLDNGIYYIRLTTGLFSKTIKLVKH